MSKYPWKELLIEKTVNYVMEEDGELVIIEKVPARVNLETGEQLLSTKTIQRLREMIKDRKEPSRVIKTPIYEFPA